MMFGRHLLVIGFAHKRLTIKKNVFVLVESEEKPIKHQEDRINRNWFKFDWIKNRKNQDQWPAVIGERKFELNPTPSWNLPQLLPFYYLVPLFLFLFSFL